MPSLDTALYFVRPELTRILEFGVYYGHTISKIREALSQEYEVFGFDSFEGLPEDWKGTDLKAGYFSTQGAIPDIPGVTFIKGFFEEALPSFVEQYGQKQCGLIHFDCDLYSSAKTIFQYLTPSIGPGTVLLFDEWVYNHDYKFNDGEQKAFYEWVLENGINYTFVDPFMADNGDKERKIVLIR